MTGESGKRSKQWPVEGGSVFMITLICRMTWGVLSLRDIDCSPTPEAALSCADPRQGFDINLEATGSMK